MPPLRERLCWVDGGIADGPRRYLMMRPDVLMGALVRLAPAARAALLDAWAESTCEFGAASLSAYARSGGGDADALLAATAAAAADLGWGRWTLEREAGVLRLVVQDSPFAAGWMRAAAGPAPVPVCAPVRGMLAALAAKLLGAPVMALETTCAAMHARGECRFEAKAGA